MTTLAACTKSTPSTESAAATPTGNTATQAQAPSVVVTEESFRCIRDMTPVRGLYVDNLLGDLDATLAVAQSPSGGTYPPGSQCK